MPYSCAIDRVCSTCAPSVGLLSGFSRGGERELNRDCLSHDGVHLRLLIIRSRFAIWGYLIHVYIRSA